MVEDQRKAEAVDAAARRSAHGDRSRAELETRLDGPRRRARRARRRARHARARRRLQRQPRPRSCGPTALADRGYGNAWIRAELERRELPFEEALAALEPERERAGRIVASRGGGAATARYLARRGFDEDTVETAFADGG